jgi:hypothetical protein
MAEYSRIAKGHITTQTGGGTAPINLPFQPDTVEWWNYDAMDAPSNDYVVKGYWDVSMGQGNAAIDLFITGPVYSTAVLGTNGGGVSTFAAGLMLQYGPLVALGASGAFTKDTNTPQITTTQDHGLVTGDWVIFQNLYESSSTGMQQISGIPFQVTVIDSTDFTINFDNSGSNYTAITAGGVNNPSFKQILYPSLYVPGTSFIVGISQNIVTTSAPHNFQIGQEIAFRIPSKWGSSELNSLPDVLTPGRPIYYYVTDVTVNTVTLANLPSYTAFNSNQVFASFPGEQFPQIVAVGDVNTGGYPYTGGNLYPSPLVYNNSMSLSSTINGPAIQGAYINNTRQGFIIGLGGAPVGSQLIYWEAKLHDYSLN